MSEPALYAPVYVRWLDCHSSAAGWHDEEEAMKTAARGIVCESVGMYAGIRGEGEQRGLALLQSRVIRGDSAVDSVLVIPVCAVKAFYTLRKT